jgi:hypothetical protein
MAHGARRRSQAVSFGEIDPSSHFLEFSRAHARIGKWFLFAIVTGSVLALVLFTLGNLIF